MFVGITKSKQMEKCKQWRKVDLNWKIFKKNRKKKRKGKEKIEENLKERKQKIYKGWVSKSRKGKLLKIKKRRKKHKEKVQKEIIKKNKKIIQNRETNKEKLEKRKIWGKKKKKLKMRAVSKIKYWYIKIRKR